MKNRVELVRRLRAGGWISGHEMAEELGISRTAVWKQIRSMRRNGFDFAASAGKGYKLSAEPDLLLPERVLSYLPRGYQGDYLYETRMGSTNDVAKRIAAHSPEGTIVACEEQTGGKGRLGRLWSSPPGGIWFSLVLKPDMRPMETGMVALAAGLAVVSSVRQATGIESGLKWPNDVLVDERKLAGLLVEVSAELGRINYLIIGVGVNANFSAADLPADLRRPAVTLMDLIGRKVDRGRMMAEMSMALIRETERLVAGSIAEVLEDWRSVSVTLGRPVRVEVGEDLIEGTAVDIGPDGALLVDTGDGVKSFRAGEVTLC